MGGIAKGARDYSEVTVGDRRGRRRVLCFGGKGNIDGSDYNNCQRFPEGKLISYKWSLRGKDEEVACPVS